MIESNSLQKIQNRPVCRILTVSDMQRYADVGEDMVCAGVSALVINTINSIDNLTEERLFEVEYR